MQRENLRDILLYQNREQLKSDNLIERDLTIKIKEFESTPFIIIITGIRRCGKSTLLHQIRAKESYFVNFDDERFINFSVDNFQAMYEVLIELYGTKNLFYFDEIQNVEGWERFVRRLHTNQNKIYITGSNASMLSGEFSTHLTGRNIALELYPFSFGEYLRFNNSEVKQLDRLNYVEKSTLRKHFQEYLDHGGFPEYLHTKKEEYLHNLYQNILYRDIITRYNIKSEKSLKITAHFAASNIGKEVSFNTLKKLTGLTSATTIKDYFQYLDNAYLIFLLPKYSPSLKKQIYANKKVYFIDSKLAKIVGFRFSEDKGRLLENTIFLELKRRRKEIYYHKGKKECDFILKTANKIDTAIQVTWALEKENRQREIDGLLEALAMYKLDHGWLLTDYQEDELNIEGRKILVRPAWKWLLTP